MSGTEMSTGSEATAGISGDQPTRSIAPLIVYLALALLFDFLAIPILEMGATRGGAMGWIMSGYFLSQASLVIVLAGLIGTPWLKGLALASCYSILAIGLVLCGESSRFDVSSVAWGTLMIPGAILIGTVPLYTGRAVLGLRLVRQSAHIPSAGERWQIEDLFLVTTAVASLLFMSHVPLNAWETSTQAATPIFAGTGGMLFVLGLFVVLPTAIFVFRGERLQGRLVVVMLYHLIIACMYAIFSYLFLRSTSAVAVPIFIAAVVAGFMNCLMYWIFHISGFRLARATRQVARPGNDAQTSLSVSVPQVVTDNAEIASPFADPPAGDAKRGNFQHRRWVLATFGLAILASLSNLALTAWRQRLDDQHEALQIQLEAVGGRATVRERTVVALTLPANATNETLNEYAYLHELRSLSLAHSQVTDDGMKALKSLFPNLSSVDLSHTNITDDALDHLVQLKSLNSFSIAYTKVTPQGLGRFLASRATDTKFGTNARRTWQWGSGLDASGLGIDDDELATLKQTQFNFLALRDNKLTDKGLASLSPVTLDVSGNAIDGSGLANSFASNLILRRVPITDSTFAPLTTATLANKSLELSETQLTDAILPMLAKVAGIGRLELGKGNITEAGLAAIKPTNMQELALTDVQFTGSCFQDWPLAVSTLDMSYSGINDQTARYLPNVKCQVLKLSHTSLTDNALKSIAACPAYDIDLTDTRVTFEGLSKTRFTSCGILRLAINQFSPDEMRKLRSVLPVVCEPGLDYRKQFAP